MSGVPRPGAGSGFVVGGWATGGAPAGRLCGPAVRGGTAGGGPPVGGVAVRGGAEVRAGADVRGGGAEARGGAATGGVTAAAAPAAGGALVLDLPASDLAFASAAGGRWKEASVSALGCFLPNPSRSRSGTLGARGGGGSHTGTPWSAWGRERSYAAEPEGPVFGGAPADCCGYCAPGRPLAGGAIGFGVCALLGGRPLPGCADGRRPFGAQLVTGAGRWLAEGWVRADRRTSDAPPPRPAAVRAAVSSSRPPPRPVGAPLL